MAIRIVKLKCKGWTLIGEPVLEKPVNVKVILARAPDSTFCSCNVECIYNTGSHGQRCMASHPWTEKEGNGVACPFSFDYPMESVEVPKELHQALKDVMGI